ncbi:MAG: hypothetical protein ACRDTU_06750 [Micromonosporaceae bacterium]
MLKRVFWLGVGVAVGVVVVRKLSRTAEAYTPRGIAASAQESAVGLLDSVREFMQDVREGMAEREAEIHAALAENAESGGLRAEDLDDQGDPRVEILDRLHELGDLADPYHPRGEPGR